MTIPSRVSSTDSGFWFEKFLPLLVLLQSGTLLGSLLLAAYSDARPTEHISFYVDDGWCDPSQQGVGNHCFGDFYFPKVLMDEVSILENTRGIPHPYFPSTTLFHRAFEIFSGGRNGLFVFLSVLAIAGIIPAFVASHGRDWRDKSAAVLGLGILSLPFLISIDRGNSVIVGAGFASLAILFARARVARRFEIFVILAALIRPQYLLLAFLTPRERVSSSVSRVWGAFLAIQSIAFGLSPGYSLGDWTTMIRKLRLFSASSPVERPYVVNLYFGRSMYRVAEVFGTEQGVARFFSDSFIPSVIVAAIGLAACALAVRLRTQQFELCAILILIFLMVGPAVGYGYYLVNAVLAAVVLMTGRAESVMTSGLLKWCVVGALFLSLVPFGWFYDESGMSVTVQLAGPSWLLVFVLALGRGGALGLRQVSAESRGK